jgi:AAA+ superfamily predicted ATPase
MEDKLVGEGGKILRGNERIVEAISDKKIWLIATANSLRGLPPELISRFQSGGIYFFDIPTDEEKQGILKLKIKAYGLEPDQELPDVTGWSGRDINNCAYKAQYLGCALAEAGEHIVPLMKSHDKDIDALRQSAHGKFLSASHPGVYEYTAPSEKMVIKPVINAGRRVR